MATSETPAEPDATPVADKVATAPATEGRVARLSKSPWGILFGLVVGVVGTFVTVAGFAKQLKQEETETARQAQIAKTEREQHAVEAEERRRKNTVAVVLVPLQGGVDRDEGGELRFQDKVSSDTVQTIITASSALDVTLQPRLQFAFYPEEKNDYPILQKDRARAVIKRLNESSCDDPLDELNVVTFPRKMPACPAGTPRRVVAVIGNTTSTATLTLAEIYSEYRLPIVAPFATKHDIAAELRQRWGLNCLVLPPSNHDQAAKIAHYLKAQEVRHVVVFRDTANLEYSDDLASQFREAFEQAPIRLAEQAALKRNDPLKAAGYFGAPFGLVVAELPVGGRAGSWYHIFGGFRTLRGPPGTPTDYSVHSPTVTAGPGGPAVEGIVIAGMTDASLQVMRQAAASGAWLKRVVLTDGATDRYLIARGHAALTTWTGNGAETAVVIAFPDEHPSRSAELWAHLKPVLGNNREPTYMGYVLDALRIVERLVRDGRSADPAAIADQIHAAISTKRIIGIRGYDLDRNGSSTSGSFSLYRIRVDKETDGWYESLDGR